MTERTVEVGETPVLLTDSDVSSGVMFVNSAPPSVGNTILVARGTNLAPGTVWWPYHPGFGDRATSLDTMFPGGIGARLWAKKLSDGVVKVAVAWA